MKDCTRRAIAYIAGRIMTGNPKMSIYDYTSSGYFPFTGNVGGDAISVYDSTEGCYISGNLPNIYHYGNNAAITLRMEEDQFSGYDYDESSGFSGTMSGNVVRIYDEGSAAYFTYSL